MHNRASHRFASEPADPGGWDAALDTGRYPGLRLAVLFAGMLLVLICVGWRLVHVQLYLPQRIARDFDRVTEEFEPIPSLNGRILAADGSVLAEDVEVIGLTAHYRWIEDPPNENWLKQQARSRLTPAERRDRKRVEAEMRRVADLHSSLWTRVAGLTGVPIEEINRRRAAIQAMVERMHRTVEARRQERFEQAQQERRRGQVSSETWWGTAWNQVVRALTTPPRREAQEPLVIQEELAYHPLLDEITLKMEAEIEAHPEWFPGLRTSLRTRRTYPHGEVAAHLIGSRTPIREEELAERKAKFPKGDPLDYQEGDWIGRTGLERYYERHLRGIRGLRRIEKNRRGEVVRTEVVRQPRDGRNLVLTLDLNLQRTAEALLDEALAGKLSEEETEAPLPQGGCIAVLDIRNGELIAGASAPRFDLNLLVASDRERFEALQADKRQPFFPRLTRMMLPPGSVFKPLSAAAFLQTGRFDPDARMMCQGYLDSPRSNRCFIFTHFGVGHGPTDLTLALAESCNVYFFSGARQLGPEPLYDWGQRFGFGRPTGIDLPGERGGNLPVPPSRRGANSTAKREPWYPADTLHYAIGQAALTVTPLQVVRMMAAIANGGELVTPRLARDAGPSFVASDSVAAVDSGALYWPEPQPIPDLSPSTLERIQEGLRQVVAHPRGTGYKTVRSKHVAIAGKTGTAEVAGREDHAWFAGYVPADRPRYAFVVVLEHAGSGGKTAGPVARALVEAMHAQGLLPGTEITRRTGGDSPAL